MGNLTRCPVCREPVDRDALSSHAWGQHSAREMARALWVHDRPVLLAICAIMVALVMLLTVVALATRP